MASPMARLSMKSISLLGSWLAGICRLIEILAFSPAATAGESRVVPPLQPKPVLLYTYCQVFAAPLHAVE
jgi:hypothetical protein